MFDPGNISRPAKRSGGRGAWRNSADVLQRDNVGVDDSCAFLCPLYVPMEPAFTDESYHMVKSRVIKTQELPNLTPVGSSAYGPEKVRHRRTPREAAGDVSKPGEDPNAYPLDVVGVEDPRKIAWMRRGR